MASNQQRSKAEKSASYLTYKVLIVGLGRIGMGYDLDLDSRTFVQTHPRAFELHPRFELVGGVDPAPQRCELFKKRYGGFSGSDLGSALKHTRPDIVVIASPTQQHKAVLQTVLERSEPRVVLCEKPLSYDIDEARWMVSACKANDCSLYVNYGRRSEPGAIEVKRRLMQDLIRTPVKGVTWYSKGLFNNGSHFFNLLEFWLGPMKRFQVIEPGRLWDGLDPEPDVQVAFEGGAIIFLAAREECFTHHEINLVARNGRLSYERGGQRITWEAAVTDPAVPGYSVLSTCGEIIRSEGARIQWHVVEQLAARLDGRDASLCSGDQALQTLESLTTIQRKL